MFRMAGGREFQSWGTEQLNAVMGMLLMEQAAEL